MPFKLLKSMGMPRPPSEMGQRHPLPFQASSFVLRKTQMATIYPRRRIQIAQGAGQETQLQSPAINSFMLIGASSCRYLWHRRSILWAHGERRGWTGSPVHAKNCQKASVCSSASLLKQSVIGIKNCGDLPQLFPEHAVLLQNLSGHLWKWERWRK